VGTSETGAVCQIGRLSGLSATFEDPDDNIVAPDVALDGFFLRHNQNIDPLVCDAAPKVLQALETAIKAMNYTPSFDTGIPNQDRLGRTLSSYELLPQLEAVVREARGQP
jgi:hypothetical protein